MKISGIRFNRIDADTWCSENGPAVIKLKLNLTTETTNYPWQISVNGYERRNRYSSPFVAVVRALDLLKRRMRDQERKVHDEGK